MKPFVTRTIFAINFPTDNDIEYYQDFQWHKPLPSGVDFFPKEESDDSIWFIADGYGMLQDNKYGLKGKYGSGAISISKKDLPQHVIDWCRNNYLEKQTNHG